MFDYNESRLTNSSFYFNDTMTIADDIQPDESIDRNLYFEYTGEEHYKIVFESKFQKYIVDLPINK